MAYINVLSSIIYSIIGYLILFQLNTFIKITHLDTTEKFYMFFILTTLIYILTQGIAVAVRKMGNLNAFVLDIFFSIVPLGILILSLQNQYCAPEYISDFRRCYFGGILIDLAIFIPVCYKFAKYGVHTN